MKIEDCKIGMLVVAKSKSEGLASMESFLDYHPLGVAYIKNITNKQILIGNLEIKDIRWFSFRPEDLVEVK